MTSDSIERTIENLTSVIEDLRAIESRGGWTIAEVKKLRQTLLNTVRHEIDPSLGHMPDSRHY